MVQGKAEDAGGLTPAKDDNTALCHFGHRTLPIFKCVDYKQALKKPRQGGNLRRGFCVYIEEDIPLWEGHQR